MESSPAMNTRSKTPPSRKRSINNQSTVTEEVIQIPIPKKRRRRSIKRKSLLDTVILMKEHISSANNTPVKIKQTSVLKETKTITPISPIIKKTENLDEIDEASPFYECLQKYTRLDTEVCEWKNLIKDYQTKEQEVKLDSAYPFAHNVESNIKMTKTATKSTTNTLNYTALSQKINQLRQSLKTSVHSVSNTILALRDYSISSKSKQQVSIIENKDDSGFYECLSADPKSLVKNLAKIDKITENIT